MGNPAYKNEYYDDEIYDELLDGKIAAMSPGMMIIIKDVF